jgi:hypothetical protein
MIELANSLDFHPTHHQRGPVWESLILESAEGPP